MSNLIPYQDVEKMAQAVAKSGLFGMKTAESAISLMLIAQAEGKHPAMACQEYDVVQGRPALKAVAMLSRFQQAGGSVVWEKYDDTEVVATFIHPQGCPNGVSIGWNMERAKKAGLTGKDNWTKYPRQMLKARVIGEGVRMAYPASCNGMLVVEEAQDLPRVVEAVEPTKPLNTIDGIKERLKIEQPTEQPVIEEAAPVDPLENLEADIQEIVDEVGGEVVGPAKSPLSLNNGESMLEYRGMVVKVNTRKTSTGKDITGYITKTSNGETIEIERWGTPTDGAVGSVCTFFEIICKVWKDKKSFMCKKIVV